MTRRKFIRTAIAAAAAAASLPLVPVRPGGPIPPLVYRKRNRTVTVNPAWKTAPYEIAFLLPGGTYLNEPWAPRFLTADDARAYLDRFKKKV